MNKAFKVARPVMTDLMDDLAMGIHEYLLEIATPYQESNFVLIPITEVVKKFGRNHRTIQRRIQALKDEGILVPVIKRQTITLYEVKDLEDQA